MFNKFLKRGLLSALLSFSSLGLAAEIDDDIPIDYNPSIQYNSWKSFEKTVNESKYINQIRGNSEIWTGGLALLTGLIGDSKAKDPVERGVYSLFQSIGIASIGVGLYDRSIGDANRRFYLMLRRTKNSFTESQLDELVIEFNRVNSFYESREDKIKMYTFGLIALVQFYNASQVTNESVKNTLLFLGGINSLIALNFAF